MVGLGTGVFENGAWYFFFLLCLLLLAGFFTRQVRYLDEGSVISQHPSLRKLLLRTGLADIVYADDNTYWGDGSLSKGANEFGKALVRLRERLWQESENCF